VTKLVGTTDVAVLVEPVHLVKDAVVESVSVYQAVLVDNVEMMVAGAILVELVPPLNHVPTVSVWGQPPRIVETDNVETTEPEEAAEIVPLVNDVAGVFVNAITIVMTETAVLLPKRQEPTLVFALKDLAVHAPLATLAVAVDDAKSCPLVLLQSLLWTAPHNVPSRHPVLF